MTALKDGRFVFIHAERQHLLVEQARSAAAAAATPPANKGTNFSPLETQVLYGGTVHAFALNASQTRIALVCPASTGTGAAAATADSSSSSSSSSHSVLRLFVFTHGEVGELLFDELIPARVEGVVWAGDRYIALDVRSTNDGEGEEEEGEGAQPHADDGTPAALFTMLIEVIKAPKRLKLLREDKAATSPAAGPGTTLCDLHTSKQSLRLWDLQRNKLLAESPLPNRKCRHGKARAAVGASSDGPFVFVVNDDWTVHGFVVGRTGAVHTPKPMLTQFESQMTHQAVQQQAAQNGDSVAEAGGGSASVSAPPSPSASASRTGPLPTPRLFTQAVSETEVLVALSGSPTILQCAYDATGKDEEWRIAAKMRLPRRLHATAEVVGLSRTKCLVYQRSPGASFLAEAKEAEGKEGSDVGEAAGGTYLVLPLEMRAVGKAPAATEPAGTAEATAQGEQQQQKPQLSANEDANVSTATAGTVESAEGADGAEGKKKRKKKKSKKAAAAKDAEASVSTNAAATPTAAAAAAGGGSGGAKANAAADADANGVAESRRGGAGGPTQRAVDRLLVHTGISSREQLPRAFEKKAADGAAAAAAEANAEAATDAAPATPTPPRGSWLSADVAMAAGGVVVGVVVGLCVMRRLSLL